jgi:putative transposase
MTIDNSMDSKAFEVFIEKCLAPQLWSIAVVVSDNCSTHKLASIKPMVRIQVFDWGTREGMQKSQ